MNVRLKVSFVTQAVCLGLWADVEVWEGTSMVMSGVMEVIWDPNRYGKVGDHGCSKFKLAQLLTATQFESSAPLRWSPHTLIPSSRNPRHIYQPHTASFGRVVFDGPFGVSCRVCEKPLRRAIYWRSHHRTAQHTPMTVLLR